MEQAVFQNREETIALWFRMWLEKKDLGLLEIFDADAVYTESWGPEYHSAGKVLHWFREWNARGTVELWDIRGYLHGGDRTVVEWLFRCRMDDGTVQSFEGISLVEWTPSGKILSLKEFGCNLDRYDPYRDGPEPRFRQEKALWF